MSAPDLRPVFDLLESAGLDIVTITLFRLNSGQEATANEAQLIESGIALLMAMLDRETLAARALELAYDGLRTDHAQALGRLALGHARVAQAARRYKDQELAALCRDTLWGEPKKAALARIPSAAKVRKAAGL